MTSPQLPRSEAQRSTCGAKRTHTDRNRRRVVPHPIQDAGQVRAGSRPSRTTSISWVPARFPQNSVGCREYLLRPISERVGIYSESTAQQNLAGSSATELSPAFPKLTGWIAPVSSHWRDRYFPRLSVAGRRRQVGCRARCPTITPTWSTRSAPTGRRSWGISRCIGAGVPDDLVSVWLAFGSRFIVNTGAPDDRGSPNAVSVRFSLNYEVMIVGLRQIGQCDRPSAGRLP